MKLDNRLSSYIKFIIPLLSIFFYIIWQMFSRAIIHIDGAGRIPLVLIVGSFFMCMSQIKTLEKYQKHAVVIWSFWVIYQCLNLWIQGSDYVFYNRWQDLYFSLIGHAVFMIVCLVQLNAHFKITIVCIILGYLINLLLYFLDSSMQLSTGYERLTSELINANEIGFQAVACLSFIPILLFCLRRISLFLAFVSLFCIYLIMSVVSRTSFVSMIPCVVAFGVVLVHVNKHNAFFKSIVVLCYILIGVFAVKQYFQSTMYERFETREDFVHQEMAQSSTLVSLFGERSLYIEDGIDSFLDHPFFGVGYTNYKFYNFGKKNYSVYRNHVEFIAELSDGGLFGFSLFIMMFFNIIAMFRYSFREKNGNFIYFVSAIQLFLALILFNFGLFTTNQTSFYSMFAVLLSFLRPQMRENKISSDHTGDCTYLKKC